MIETILLNYGGLGIFLIYFLYKEKTFQAQIIKVIENNTEVLLIIKHEMEKEKKCKAKEQHSFYSVYSVGARGRKKELSC